MREESDSEESTSLNWDEFIGHATSEDLVSSILDMYDALICTTNTSPELVTLPNLASTKSAIDFSSLKRKSIVEVPKIKTENQQCMKRSSTNQYLERKRPPDPPPAPPNVVRPLSISSMASLSSTSSSSVSSCGHIARIRRTGVVHNSAYLASIESLESSQSTLNVSPPGRANQQQRRQRSKCVTVSSTTSTGSGDSGVCSPCSFISSPSPVIRPRYCDPQLSYMDRVVMEIVETEGVYVSDLQQIIVGYLERWRSSPEYPFTEQQLNDLFSNIQDIFHFNKSFLRDLEQCGLDPVKIAQSFVRNNEGFSVYTDYCTNYPRTMSVLTELMRQESAAKLFRERQVALQHTLPLGSYLLKPVQRILKYHLLLNNIVKQCSSESQGYEDIKHALSTMTSIAQHINHMKRKHEHAVRVQEIQSLLLGWHGEDLTTFGELCGEGAFRLSGAKALRHAFLFDRMLLITKKKEEGILGYKAHIMCSNLMLIESVPGEPLCFHVIPFDNPKNQYTLQARNLDQKREWCLQLKKVILENYNAVIPSHARQLVMQLGQNKTGDEELAEKHSTPKRQHSAPEYLEKRKQEKRRKSELCLLRTRFQPRVLRKSDVGTTTKSQQEIRQTIETIEQEKEEDRTKNDSSDTNIKSDKDLLSVPSPSPSLTSTASLEEEHRTLENIISQLLMQNGEFVKFVNKTTTRKHPRRKKLDTSEDEEDADYDNLSGAWSPSPQLRWQRAAQSPKLIHRSSSLVRRAHSFSSRDTENSSGSPDQSVDSSLSRFSLDNSNNAGESTSLWVKHQAVTEGNKKSDSLPRSFQIGGTQTPDWSMTVRPITIASDKAQELNLVDMQNYINRAEALCNVRRGNCFPTNLDDTTEEEMMTSTAELSSHQLYVHPEYRIYKSGLSKTMLRHIVNKISSLRSSETLSDPPPPPSPCYAQGSSRLGARIAHCADSSDYADPRTLFPAITPSKKAASVLGIRDCHGSTMSLTTATKPDDKQNQDIKKPADEEKTNPLKQINEIKLNELRLKLSQTRIEHNNVTGSKIEDDTCSVGSGDSFYERSFEAMEHLTETEIFRDSAVFSDQDDAFSDDMELPIPPPKQFDTKDKQDGHKFKGECMDISNPENKKLYSKLDICKPNRKDNKLCIVKPLINLSNVTPRSKKIIQISKVSLNSIPDLDIKYSEKYIKGDQGDKKNTTCSQCSPSRRHSCKSIDAFTSCHKCNKPPETDIMSKSCDFTRSISCRECVQCSSNTDVVCSVCCSQCSVDTEDSSSAASTVIEVSPTRQGWVKHVVNRLQSF
uniref:Pleckstrin homology domain-containing family G member 1 n=1 Tax=Cacopsylla melanoneura TaxID=428564 RepID=A0A8D8ZS71_9HEMI